MFKELFTDLNESKELDHSYEPATDTKYDQWNNPGQVMSILRMGPLPKKKVLDIVVDNYKGKLDLDKMEKLGYISSDGDIYSVTQFGRDVLSYLSGFSTKKPSGYKGK